MNPLNQSSSTSQAASLPSDTTQRAENANFIRDMSASQNCGQRVISDIVQNSTADESVHADLEALDNMFSDFDEKEVDEEQFGNAATKRGQGVARKDQDVARKEQSVDTKAAGRSEEVANVNDLLESLNAINHVTVICNIRGNKVTVIEGAKLSGQQLQRAHEHKTAAVIHVDRLFVHPSAGLAHGQKVTLDDGRTVTVHHFTEEQWQKLTQVVMLHILKIANIAKVEDLEGFKKLLKEHPLLSHLSFIYLVPHRKDEQSAKQYLLKLSELFTNPNDPKSIQKIELAARKVVYLILLIDQILEKRILKLEDQAKKFDETHWGRLKQDRFIRQIPSRLLVQMPSPLRKS